MSRYDYEQKKYAEGRKRKERAAQALIDAFDDVDDITIEMEPGDNHAVFECDGERVYASFTESRSSGWTYRIPERFYLTIEGTTYSTGHATPKWNVSKIAQRVRDEVEEKAAHRRYLEEQRKRDEMANEIKRKLIDDGRIREYDSRVSVGLKRSTLSLIVDNDKLPEIIDQLIELGVWGDA